MEIQQSSPYLKYVSVLGWKVDRVDGVAVITKQIPFLGGLAKIQRPDRLPSLSKLIPFLKSEKIKTVAPEPDASVSDKKLQEWSERLSKDFKINKSSYLPTKTIRVDLTSGEDTIFKRFSEAKQRGVRRALKHGVTVKTSANINDLIKIKNKSAGLLGFITTYGIKELWPILGPKHGAILLAYSPKNKLIGGILLLYMDKLAYYWIAGATREGKKIFAPTLLVWEALKLSKKLGNREFDFVGVWDERRPEYFKAWHGFTKFKEGFGGKNLYYPLT